MTDEMSFDNDRTPGMPLDDALDKMLKESDAIGYGFITAMAKMESDFTRRGWDQPATLFHVTRVSATRMVNIPGFEVPDEVRDRAPENEQQGGFGIMILQVGDDSIFDDCTGPEISMMLREMAKTVGEMPYPDDSLPIGWILHTEAWMLTMPKGGNRADYERDLEKDPRSVEVRQLIGMDVAGQVYALTRIRGDENQPFMHLASPTDESQNVDSHLIDSLKILNDATVASQK